MNLQGLKLLCPTVKEMHLKVIHYWTFDLDLGVKVTYNVAQCPLHYVNYAPVKFESAMSNSLEDARNALIDL